MSDFAALKVEMALGGSYRQEVSNDAPLLWWRLTENSGASADGIRDSSNNTRHGVIEGGPIFPVYTDVPTAESGAAMSFTNGYIRRSPGTFADFTGAFTVEYWIKRNGSPGAAESIVRKKGVGGADGLKGWSTTLDTSGRALFTIRNAADSANAFSFNTTGSVCNNAWHHIVCTWDGTTGANGAKIYVDGAVNAQATASTASVSVATTIFYVGATDGFLFPYTGLLGEVVIYSGALSAARIAAHYAAAPWTDVTADVLKGPGLDLTFGISGNGPLDRLADVGSMTFWLDNSERNSAQTLGYYSPQNENVRVGFRQGIFTRAMFFHEGVYKPGFLGKINSIDPAPGIYKSRRTEVVVNDLMSDIVDADLRNVTLQLAKTEVELIRTLIEAIPVTAQPLSLNFDDGLDTSPFAFDKLGGGQKAYGPLNDLIVSSIGFGSIGPSGVFRYENRLTRQGSVSLFTLDGVNDLVTPSTLEGVFNHFRATLHPKTHDSAATTVLWSQTGSAPAMQPGETRDIWGTYFNPDITTERIGGTDQVAPVATTDFTSNTAANGSGTDKTVNLVVTAVPFASTVKFTITNNDGGVVYLTKLRIRGKGLFDLSPVTVESFAVQPYGDRAQTIDLKYQSDYDIGQNLVEYLRVQFEDPFQQATSFKFQANRDSDYLSCALETQVGDRLTISEAVTGLTLAAVFVHTKSLRVYEGNLLECEFGVSSSAFFSTGVWVMGDADLSLLGSTTIFGYA